MVSDVEKRYKKMTSALADAKAARKMYAKQKKEAEKKLRAMDVDPDKVDEEIKKREKKRAKLLTAINQKLDRLKDEFGIEF